MFIYLITNLVNGKYYVGQTAKQTPATRLTGHRAQARQGSSMRVHAAMRKYPRNAFVQEIIATADTQEQLDSLERLWILLLDSRNFEVGYNAGLGGDARSRESAAKAGLSMRGANNPNFGKTMSVEQRNKIAESRKGKGTGPRPASVCRKISATRRAKIASGEITIDKNRLRNLRVGIANSAESNDKRSATLTGKYVGELNSMYKHVHTEKTRAKMRASHAARKEKNNG